MATRQALEADGQDLYLDAATVRELLPELETKDEHDRCTFSSVVALSYARVTPADPDPAGAQLAQLRPVLVWWMCERARRRLRPTSASSSTSCDVPAGRPTGEARYPADASFGAARNIGTAKGTVVFKLTNTPPGGDPDRVYHRRGWTHLERRLGDLEAPDNSLDVSAGRRPRPSAPPGGGAQSLGKPRRRSAGRRSCASRRRSSPRRATISPFRAR